MLDVFLVCSLTKDMFFRLGLYIVAMCSFVCDTVCVRLYMAVPDVRQCLSEKYINLAKLMVCFGLAKHFAVKIRCSAYLYNGISAVFIAF